LLETARAFRRAFDAVLVFDVILANSMPDNAVIRAGWHGARRIDRAPKKRGRGTGRR
jgi:hypothetical protein